MVDSRVQLSPEENLWAIQMVLNFNHKTIVGPDKISYLLSDGGDAGGALGQQLKAKTNLRKDKEQELGSWDEYLQKPNPCFF